jgi:hypothetical protein
MTLDRRNHIYSNERQQRHEKDARFDGVTVNAMALIAPGAFLWMTYQLQAANVDASGAARHSTYGPAS